MDKPIVFTSDPISALALEQIDCSKVVYYCADEYSMFYTGRMAEFITDMEQRMAQIADVVITVNEDVCRRKRRIHPKVYCIPHGVDTDHFQLDKKNYAVPKQLEPLPKPLIGYVGLIRNILDFDLIESIARQRPEWSIVLIGWIHGNVDKRAMSKMKSLRNVFLTGPVSYSRLPEFMQALDVCLIPYRITEQVKRSNPLVTFEYFSMGKPVISTPIPFLMRYLPHLDIASTGEEFVSRIECALTEDVSLSARRQSLTRDLSWDRIAEMVWEILMPQMGNRHANCLGSLGHSKLIFGE